MDWLGWGTFGLVATAVLTIIMSAAQSLNLSRMDIPTMLGSMLVEDPDRARVAGLVAHLGAGQAFALVYAGAFAAYGRSTWWLGLLIGLVHGMTALLVILPVLPGMHPRMASVRSGPEMRTVLEPPGALGLNYGVQTPAVTILAHLVFGLLLGVTLGP